MKIIHVLNHFLPHQTAGTEVYVWALSKALRKVGHEVKVLIPNYNSTSSVKYNYDEISVYKFAEPSIVDRQLIMGFREPEGLAFFVNYLKEENPDIIHFHELAGSNGIGMPHVRASKKIGAKIVMTFHLAGYSCQTGTLIYKGISRCNGIINRYTCSTCYLHKKGLGVSAPIISMASNLLYNTGIDPRKLNNSIATAFGTAHIIQNLQDKLHELIELNDQVVCLTHWFKNILLSNGVSEKKISYVPQGLPTPVGDVVIKNKNSNKLRLLFIGRISQFKGLHLLIEALESLPENEIELSIYGQGDGTTYESNCRERTKDKRNIHWMGNLSQERVYEEMRNHDLLCLCSTFSEMSPLVIQEARAAKLTVLASDVNGNSEQFKEGAAGFLFEMNNVSSLKNKLFEILTDKSILHEFEAKIKLPRNFQDIGIEYQEIYQKILK